MIQILKWLKEEITSIIPAIIYFVIAFNFIHFTIHLGLEDTGVTGYYTYTGVTIIALIMGKVLIIVKNLPFINLFPTKPMIYNIIWKSLVYNLFVLFLRVGEHIIHLLRQYKNISVAIAHLKTSLASPDFWAAQVWLFIVLLGFILFNEFARVIGKEKMLRMLFG